MDRNESGFVLSQALSLFDAVVDPLFLGFCHTWESHEYMSLAKWLLAWQGLRFCLIEVRGIDSRLRCLSVEIGLLR